MTSYLSSKGSSRFPCLACGARVNTEVYECFGSASGRALAERQGAPPTVKCDRGRGISDSLGYPRTIAVVTFWKMLLVMPLMVRIVLAQMPIALSWIRLFWIVSVDGDAE